MSKLLNAPLLEVIFELRWNMDGNGHWDNFPFLHGDFYALLKERYPIRKLLVPSDIPVKMLENKAIYRYSTDKGYPMVQLGPGILSLNTTDDFYNWENYSEEIKKIIDSFNDVYSFDKDELIISSLSYFDFLEFDWEEEDILSYIDNKLKISIIPSFYDFESSPRSFGLGLSYKTEIGIFNLRVNKGNAHNNKSGLILQFQLTSFAMKPEPPILNDWLDNGHNLCSKLFKEITKGELYDSFT